MDDTREELVMDYSPILGVTYGLKNVLVEDRDEEEYEIIYNPKKARPEKRLKKVTPEKEDQGPEYDSAGFSIEDRE